MIVSVRKIFAIAPFTQEAHAAYTSIVKQARLPWFYEMLGVPDTVDGRFDLVVLHLFLVANRLQEKVSENTSEFVRVLSEVFFADMDQSLREMGSSDTGTGKRVKAMAQAFYGRLQNYEQTVHSEQALKESLRRNLYRESPNVTADQLSVLTAYVLRNRQHLMNQSAGEILQGQLSFIN